MALNFTAVSLKTIAAKKAGKVYTEEFQAEYAEAMEHILNAGLDALAVEFPDAAARDKWFNDAKSYGLTLNVPMNIRRIKGTDSDNKDHGRLTFTLETMANKEENAAKAKANRERVEILKSHGHDTIRGKKTPEQIAAENETLRKHYNMSETDQAKHLEKYRSTIAK